jgi:hypothetical protein
MAGFQCGDSGDYTPDPDCRAVTPWDGDCDKISDRTEQNATNQHLGFQLGVKDANPSIAGGTSTNGTLTGGIDLATPCIGCGLSESGYYEYQGGDGSDTDHWGTLALINTIEKVGRAWWGSYEQTPCWVNQDSPRMGVGDMSLQPGGSWKPDHNTHQQGIDVDIRYVRKTSPFTGEGASLDIVINPADLDTNITIDLLNCFGYRPAGNEVDFVFIHYSLYDVMELPVPDWLISRTDHSNHFHVRILDPDGPNND